ncbi:MAG TPA: glycosyltransferase family 39 protein [Streptosporangiaceae bacterium]|nr:glycosyltransferase family 39 protein [Streptosporangiaceae bacterium]
MIGTGENKVLGRHATRGPGSVTRLRGPLTGRPAASPAWYRPALIVLLLFTALLYLWDLSSSGNANSFYAAAAQAGSLNWKAWFFGSLDKSNFITVDKPPGALWVMGLSARMFGYSSWSLLVPQALEGVAAVGLLAGSVRRVAGPAAGLIAGLALALTPAAVLIFRFDNPDALLVLLLVLAAYCVTRALAAGRTRWLVAAGVAVGFAFLTKSGQALLPVPALGLAYLVAAPVSLRRRVLQLLAALAAMVVAAGWWIAAVVLWPAAGRPYIGGSTDNNPLELAFGYNGLGRLFGGQGNAGGGGGGGANTGFGGATGLARLFRGEFGLEISWLLPAALLLLGAGVWLTWGRGRTDRVRAAVIVWGGWLLVTAATFSYMKGTIHPYYTVALAPAIAALVGIGGVLLWERRRDLGRVAYAALAVVALVTCAWDVRLLRSEPSFHPSVADVALAITALAVVALVAAAVRLRARGRIAVVAGLGTALALAVPVGAFGLATAGTPHSGSIPTAVAGTGSGGLGGGGRPGAAGRGALRGGGPTGTETGGSPGSGGTRPGGGAPDGQTSGQPPSGLRGRAAGGTRDDLGGGGPGGGGGTPGGGAGASQALVAALEKTTTRWAAATDGSQSAASLELASGGKAVMAIGGFTGSDPAPTLAQFKAYVAAGDITYYIAGGGMGGGPGGGGSASQITSWVEAHFKSVKIGGQTVYVLHK